MYLPYQGLLFKVLFWVAFTQNNNCVDFGRESTVCTNRASNCAKFSHYCPGLNREFESWWEWMVTNCEGFCGICHPLAESGCDRIPDSFFINGDAKRYCSLTNYSSLTISTDCTTYGFAGNDECSFFARIESSLLCAPSAELDCWEFDTNGNVCETFEQCIASEVPEGYEPILNDIPYIGSTFNATCSEGWSALPGWPTCTCHFPSKVFSCNGCTSSPTGSPSFSEQNINLNTVSGGTTTSQDDCETFFGLEFCNIGFPVIYIFILIIGIMSCWISIIIYMCYLRQKKQHSKDLEAIETIRKDIDTIRRHIDLSKTPVSLEDRYGLEFGSSTSRSMAGAEELNNTTRSLPLPGGASNRDPTINYAHSYPIIHQQNDRNGSNQTSEDNLDKVISSDTGGGDFTDLDDFENSKYLNPPESCGFWGGIIKACFEDPDEYPTMTASIDVITKSSRNN